MPQDLPPEISTFAKSLGPYSSAWMQREGGQAALDRLDAGRSVRDAVLGSVFSEMLSSSPQASGLLNEFWEHINRLLRRMSSRAGATDHGHDALQSAVRTILNSGDNLYFRTEVEFLSLLSKRIKWKESNQYRKRRPETLDTAGWAGHAVGGAGTATRVAGDEVKYQAIARLKDLSRSDRKLVLARLSSTSSGAALDALGMNDSTGRRALNRAMQRFRRLIAPGAS